MKNKLIPSLLGLAVIVLALMPLWGSQYFLYFLFLIFFYATISLMWNMLSGFSGLISLGQPMFIGLGGYALAILSLYHGVNIWLSILIGAAACVIFALLISVPIFRMGGLYFAIGTWMIAEALGVSFGSWGYVRYGMGLTITPAYTTSFTVLYYAALALLVIAVGLIFFTLRSRIGLALMAMRDDPEAAQTMGVNLFRYKLYCFMMAAFVTGAASGVYYLYNVFIMPKSAFSISWTIAMAFIVIIGGIGTIEGPILGAILYVFLRQWLAEYGALSLVILGVVTVATILLMPKGIMGTIEHKFNFNVFSSRHKPRFMK